MTSRETYAALKPLIQEVALQLTKQTKSEWTLRKSEEGEYTYFHLDSGDAHLLIGTEYNTPTKLHVQGITPRGKDRQYVRVYEERTDAAGNKIGGYDEFKYWGIGVAIARGAETIAKEITRRFLPDYLKAVRLVEERIARDEQYATNKRANLEACAVTLNEPLRNDWRPIHGCDAVYEPLGSFSSHIGETIRVEVNASATDVDVKFENLTVSQARRLLKYAQEIHQKYGTVTA